MKKCYFFSSLMEVDNFMIRKNFSKLSILIRTLCLIYVLNWITTILIPYCWFGNIIFLMFGVPIMLFISNCIYIKYVNKIDLVSIIIQFLILTPFILMNTESSTYIYMVGLFVIIILSQLIGYVVYIFKRKIMETKKG